MFSIQMIHWEATNCLRTADLFTVDAMHDILAYSDSQPGLAGNPWALGAPSGSAY